MPIDINVLKELMAVDYSLSGPLSHVEDVPMPEPWDQRTMRSLSHIPKTRRGRKTSEEWVTEMRMAWRHIDDEHWLEKSWLADLPQVQTLAASKHGGRSIGKGLALQELLRKAVFEAQQYTTDERTHEVLLKYPRVPMGEIAKQFDVTREQLSRACSAKAAGLVVRAFQVLLSKPRQDLLKGVVITSQHRTLSSVKPPK